MCQLLAEPGIERKADGEIWYWYQVERAKTSHKLWSSKGAQALEARLAQTPDGRGNLCLQRALREALSHKVQFDKDLNRTICVDVRYVLWCIDKLGGAKNIIDELKLIR